MENPATWGHAEIVVSQVLREFFDNQERAITDPAKVICGPSLEWQITSALRDAGLMLKAGYPPQE